MQSEKNCPSSSFAEEGDEIDLKPPQKMSPQIQYLYTVTPLKRITRERQTIRYKLNSLYPGRISHEKELFQASKFISNGNPAYPGSL